MRYVMIAMAAVLAGFAVLQYNDPDALIWIGLYGAAATTTLIALKSLGESSSVLDLLIYNDAALLYLIGAVWIWPADGSYWLESEEKRESLGLLITSAWMAFLLLQASRYTKATAP
jgi:hypothetical protein